MKPEARSWRRRVFLLGAVGAVTVIGLSAIFHRPIISYVVTRLAMGDAERWAGPALQAPLVG